jgi:hypothetical protein
LIKIYIFQTSAATRYNINRNPTTAKILHNKLNHTNPRNSTTSVQPYVILKTL